MRLGTSINRPFMKILIHAYSHTCSKLPHSEKGSLNSLCIFQKGLSFPKEYPHTSPQRREWQGKSIGGVRKDLSVNSSSEKKRRCRRRRVFRNELPTDDRAPTPLQELDFNKMKHKALGKHGILCIEDIVHEIVNLGPHFKEVISFLWPFQLDKPEGGLQGRKTFYVEGGDAGNREDHINQLIDEMN